MSQKITIATRKSPLALWQAEFVKTQLLKHYPDSSIELLPMVTQGDTLLEVSLTKVGGKGLFLKELEKSLLVHESDIAVHSLKDMPAQLEKDFCIAAILERADARDAFLSARFNSLQELPPNAVIGTSSLRRSLQIKMLLPHCEIKPLRGNVGTRLKKLKEDEFDAIILAAAGLKRLGLEEEIKEHFSIDSMIPAAGQGVLAIECRADDEAMKSLLQPLNHCATAKLIAAERTVIRTLQAGCQTPLAVYAHKLDESKMQLMAFLASPSGEKVLRVKKTGLLEQSEDLGYHLAEELIERGAKAILKEYENYDV